MDRQQYRHLTKNQPKPDPMIHIGQLNNQEPRTLLWGYTTERQSHHVYIAQDKLFVYVYGSKPGMFLSGYPNEQEFKPGLLVPNKRLYPEACDYEFCLLLKEHAGVYLPFTTWNDERLPKQYHGELHPLHQTKVDK